MRNTACEQRGRWGRWPLLQSSLNRLLMGGLCLWASGGTSPAAAQEFINGYTYVAPSYYLTPPVLVAPPVVTVFEPAFLHTTVVPYDPVWPYAYMGLPGSYYSERVTVRPRGVDYRLRTYTPRRRDFR